MKSYQQISGQDKPSPAAITPRHHVPYNNMESSQHSMGLKTPCRLSAHPVNNAQGDVSFFYSVTLMLYHGNSHSFGSFYLHAELPSLFVAASIL